MTETTGSAILRNTVRGSVMIASREGLTAPSSVRQIVVSTNATGNVFFPLVYWQVTMGVELATTCGTNCGYSVCALKCTNTTLAPGSSFAALPDTSVCGNNIFVYDATTARSGSPAGGIEDVGPHSTSNPYWFTGNYTPGGTTTLICGSDAFISGTLGGSVGCSFGNQNVYWRFSQ